MLGGASVGFHWSCSWPCQDSVRVGPNPAGILLDRALVRCYFWKWRKTTVDSVEAGSIPGRIFSERHRPS
eukprot:8518256-Pyramimonas_sp.AAC.1